MTSKKHPTAGAPTGNKNAVKEVKAETFIKFRTKTDLKTRCVAAAQKSPELSGISELAIFALEELLAHQCPHCGKLDFDTAEYCKKPNIRGPGVGQWVCEM